MYKKCPRLRNSLFLLLRNMWEKKSLAKRCEIAEGIYLPKEKKSQTLGQFRSISLLNIDGKIMFGILAKRIISFVRNNGYVDESVQKAGIPQVPGCVEHTYASRLRHQAIIGSTQTGRSGLGVTQFKPFSQSNAKEIRNAVVKEVRQVEQESR